MHRRPSFLSPDHRRSGRATRAAVLAGTALAACIGASLAFAGFNSAVGSSTGTTQATFSTSIPEVTSTDQANGLVVRVYPWETGATTRKVNVDLATVTGATPYVAAFTGYETQAVDDTSGAPSTLAWSLATADSTTFTDATTWPSATPTTAKYLKLTFDPTIPTGSVITSVTLTNGRKASANVTNSGTLCYYLEPFN